MIRSVLVVLASMALAGCGLQYVLGFPEPQYIVAAPTAPIELSYREGKGGLVLLTGRVNGKADVEFILDTGAPVTVLLDGKRTAALGLDSSKARRLGDGPASPTGDIQGGFRVDFGGVALHELTAVVIPQGTMPCQERFEEIGFGGVIGADLFRRFVVEIDPVAKRIRLSDPKVWRAPASAVVMPLHFRSGHPFVETRLAMADGRIVETTMHLDTGMNRALALVAGGHPALTMPANGKPRKSCLVNGVREEREGDALTVELADLKLPVAAPIYSDIPNPVNGARNGTLGVGLFSGRRIYIDYPGKRLAVES